MFPGQYRRVDALKLYGATAIQLVYGIIPMLIIAGTLEGFFSPNPAIPTLVKYLTGTVLFVSLVAYLSRKRRQKGASRDKR